MLGTEQFLRHPVIISASLDTEIMLAFLVYIIQSWYPEPYKIQNCLRKTKKSSDTFIHWHTYIHRIYRNNSNAIFTPL